MLRTGMAGKTVSAAGVALLLVFSTEAAAGVEVKPYGWVQLNGYYYSEEDEGFSNIRLTSARVGGKLLYHPLTAVITLETFLEHGPELYDAYVLWNICSGLSVKAGQFKTPFGIKYNMPAIVDELPTQPVSLEAAAPGRQMGLELSYDFGAWASLHAALLSGVGRNKEPNTKKVAFAVKLVGRPLAFSDRLGQLVVDISFFHYNKANGWSPDLGTPLGLTFYHGAPANGDSYRLTVGGAFYYRFITLRGEFFMTADGREEDTDGDPATPGLPRPSMRGSGFYLQAAAVVTGQTIGSRDLLPELKSRSITDSAVELAVRFEMFHMGAEDLSDCGIMSAAGGVNWHLFNHLKIYAAFYWQSLDEDVPEIPGGASYGVIAGVAGHFLD